MIKIAQPGIQTLNSRLNSSFASDRFASDHAVEAIRRRINDENYLNSAIQRLALVMSNELLDISSEGGKNERKRRK
ncbi:MAG: hypothetical protein FWD47_07190 [Treponema sp.]|nr:hypothetical protein [Treponema sp.]